MNYYPILLDLRDKKCVVIGGGRIAQRKACSLLKNQAQVSVISPTLTAGLKRLFKKGKILWIRSDYKREFLRRAFLVVAATNNKQINLRVYQDTKGANILINIVDSPKESTFIVPAVIQNKDLIISVSTSGKVPYLARRMKEDIKKTVIPRYIKALGILEIARQELKESCRSAKRRKTILAQLTRKALNR
jgi:siroheme synthase-like protein